MKIYIFLISVLLTAWACSEDAIDSYKSTRYLYFSKPEVLDSATFLSFSHYPGATEKKINVEVTLIGDLLEENTTYQLEIDQDSTTAAPSDYELNLTQTFAANQIKDSIEIKVFNKNLDNKEVTLYLRIVENENFSPGLKKNRAARIIFNDIDSQPLWWTSSIETLFLGKWTPEKYARFIESSGITDLTGYEFTAIRKICLQFKEDIRLNGWTEKDGSPMELTVN